MITTKQPRIFISYSHRGNGLAWKEQLLRHLAVFEKHHVLDVWHDDETVLGADWHANINAAMGSARLAVLLLTDEFLKSPFVRQHELPELQRRHQEEGLLIAPILCEKCNWEADPWIASLQIKPRVQATPVPLSSFCEAVLERSVRQLATEIAVELGNSTLAELSAPSAPPSEIKTYLDKFPLTRGPGLREEKLIGREQELTLLDLSFAQPQTAIVSLVAWGGVGKTVLVQDWLRKLEREHWLGVRRVYAWSFYSQGTKEDRQASEDMFLSHALGWFGVPCKPTLSPWDKGRLLADAVAEERTLLILDGIEPLQYPPGPMGGQLRAPGMQSLLKHLARKAVSGLSNQASEASNCLCVATTREPLTDLVVFQRREGSSWGSVLGVDLGNLTNEAGAALLHHAGANRAGAAEIKPDDKELLAASREVDGHALTLNLLGRFLARAHGGDIRRRDLVKFDEADREEQGGTTFKMLAAFENWFAKSGEFGARQLAILRILGLFDRPADAGCIGALRRPPVIAGLTDPLFTMRPDSSTGQAIVQPVLEDDWNTATSFLNDFDLVTVQADADSSEYQINCHPLIREHFANSFHTQSPQGWQAAHQRLYEHLCNAAPDCTIVSRGDEFEDESEDEMMSIFRAMAGIAGRKLPQPTLDDLQPLYQAMAHGCQAGLQQGACDEVYNARILRGTEDDGFYSSRKLGAFGLNLTAVACFFEQPWCRPSPRLIEPAQVWLQHEAFTQLRALGRLTEALEPIRSVTEITAHSGDFRNAAVDANNLSELEQLLGDVAGSVGDAEKAVSYADHTNNEFLRMGFRTTHADVLHQAGRRTEAESLFRKAEEMQTERQPYYPLLYGLAGFRYCDLLIAPHERIVWQTILGLETGEAIVDTLTTISRRAAQTLPISEQTGDLLSIALDHLTLGRAALYEAILRKTKTDKAKLELDTSVDGLRSANHSDFLPLSLSIRAAARFLHSKPTGLEGAQSDLDEAWELAERGPMKLFLADIHLYRARLFFREKHYPWGSPAVDLAAAEKLINECGYHRRDEELADAKRAILGA